jgi:ABC-type multidrug transport system fused ATPase/permease subunit
MFYQILSKTVKLPRIKQKFAIANNLLFILRKLRVQDQKKLILLLCLMCVSSISETVSIGSVIPFIGFIAYPERLWQKPQIQYFAGLLNFRQPSDFVILFSFAFVVSILLSAGLRTFNLYYSSFSIQRIGSHLGSITFSNTIHQPYQDQISVNSKEVINASLSLTGSFVQLLSGVLSVLNSLLTAGFIFVLLTVVSPFLTLAILGFVAFVYSVLILSTKSSLKTLGRVINDSNIRLIAIVQESLGGIREVIINNLRLFYFREYGNADLQMRLSLARYQFVSSYPRIVVEAAALLAVAIFSLTIVFREGEIQAYLPIIAAVAIAFQKLLPLSQAVFNGISLINFNQDSLEKIVCLFKLNSENCQLPQDKSLFQNWQTLSFENISFRYGPTSNWIFKHANFSISRGECIGIVGESGSGKTTLVDIISGLLTPEGERYIDHVELSTDNLQSWRHMISIVPQNVHLITGTILENICYLKPTESSCNHKAFEAARVAHIHDFITSLPDGYQTMIGERGVNISGGQRQRIAIARAIYLQSSILIFDEATSALDKKNELNLINNLKNLPSGLTKIFITHGKVDSYLFDRVLRVSEQGVETMLNYTGTNH